MIFNIRRLAVSKSNTCINLISENNKIFVYKNNVYEKLFDFNIETILSDILLNSDIKIDIVNENEGNYLYIVLDLSHKRYRRNYLSRIRLLQLCSKTDVNFFCTNYTNAENECEYNKDSLSDSIFDLLNTKHKINGINKLNESKLAECIRPILRPYQAKAVAWMIDVETKQQEIKDFEKIEFFDCSNQIFYINQFNLDISASIPKNILPLGGILADEMGLGKTIEMLSLILLRPTNTCASINDVFINEEIPSDDEIPLAKLQKLSDKVFCVCLNKDVTRNMIKCINCKILQHIKCVRKFSEPSVPHICPGCWTDKCDIIKSRATIIITPATIKKQWHQEILKHVLLPLKVLIYPGISNFWMSPYEVANYDIVLTDYNTLKKEIYFAAENKTQCKFRNSRKYMRKESPLLRVLWYRVCLDEAQMVESTNLKASQMVKLLPAIHRWTVTGTPIQKSLDDIRGLLEFLDAYPLYEKNYWTILIKKFYAGETDPLINSLSTIMWRTCKKSVISELNIPKQLEKIHYITLDDAEKLFYFNEREFCLRNFNEKVSKLITESGRLMSITKLDTNTLRKILEPMKKLRQDCTAPILIKFQNSQNSVKKLLQPQELLEHLKTSNEIECKNQIRLMASNYNGLASIHMILEDYENAIKMYESVISLSKEFSGPLSVDSLLQIHALHNIQIACGLNKNFNKHCIDEIANNQGELEWKYINTYYKNYQEAFDCWSKTNNILNIKLGNLGIRGIEEAFVNILEEINCMNMSDTFLMKLHEESNFTNDINEYYRTIKTVEIYIINWLEKLVESRNKVLKEFKNFIEIISMIKPKESLNTIISKFVKTVFECHLKDIRKDNDETEDENDDNNKNEICDLCQSKVSLTKYECLIFNKRMDEKTNLNDGTWNPCRQENVLKLALSVVRNKNIPSILIKQFEKSLEIIELFKKEYKELSKLWSEIEFIVKAYDELEMCKMRLTAIEDNHGVENKKTKSAIYQIPLYQIDETFDDLSFQLNRSKMEFYKKLGRLKYIKHLEQNTEPENCPICKVSPKSKYCVLDCGHVMCIMCLNKMTLYQTRKMNCAVCRTSVNNIFFVTRKPIGEQILIKGEYSTKIHKIVSTIIKLKRDDSKVKILIFSHWKSILKTISSALNDNSITHRLMWLEKSVEEFKDDSLDVSCMLMLLSQGSKGLNLIEATHLFLVEPILNISDELQAINRVHRIGQTRVTTVHRFIVRNTIDEQIFNTMSKLKSLNYNNLTIQNLSTFFDNTDLEDENMDVDDD